EGLFVMLVPEPAALSGGRQDHSKAGHGKARGQEGTGDRGQETGDRRQETGDRGQETEAGSADNAVIVSSGNAASSETVIRTSSGSHRERGRRWRRTCL